MHVFSQNNYKIENGSKKTFTIIPKSAKFAKSMFSSVNDSQYTVLVYNSGNQNFLINDWYACLQVLSKQLYEWNAYLSLLGYYN